MKITPEKKQELRDKYYEWRKPKGIFNSNTDNIDYWLNVLEEELQKRDDELVEKIQEKNRDRPVEHGYRYDEAMQDAIEIIKAK